MKPIPRNELKVGMIVVFSKIDSNCCLPKNLAGMKIRINKIDGDTVSFCTLEGSIIGICWCKSLDNLYLVEEPRGEITWENLKKGDSVQSKDDEEAKVLIVLDDIFLLSRFDHQQEAGDWFLKTEARNVYGYSIIQPTPTKPIREVTQEEVNEKFGEEVRIKG